MKRPVKTPPDEKAKYEPTVEEQAALKFLAEGFKNSQAEMKISKTGSSSSLAPSHPDLLIGYAMLAKAMGTNDLSFLNMFLKQLASVGATQAETDEGVNFVLSIVKGVRPKDQMEAMLAAQMAAVHLATMTFARRLAQVETIAHQDSAERAFNKLARTFTTQIEALKRYRTGGEQKMTVQHVTVSEGGQAIVGNVTNKSNENGSKPAAAFSADRAESSPILSRANERAPVRLRRVK
jgi:hypothetical protein